MDGFTACPANPPVPTQPGASLKPEPLLLLLLLLWLVLEISPLPLPLPSPYRQESSTQRICAVTATKWHTLPPITNRCQIACEYGTDSR